MSNIRMILSYKHRSAEEVTVISSIYSSIRNIVQVKKTSKSFFISNMDSELSDLKRIFYRVMLNLEIEKFPNDLLKQLDGIFKVYSLICNLFMKPSQPKGLSVRPAWSASCTCEENLTECTMCGLFKRKHQHYLQMHKRMVYVFLALRQKFSTMRPEIFFEIQENLFDRNTVTPFLINRSKNIRINLKKYKE